jgi:hypothetical protein
MLSSAGLAFSQTVMTSPKNWMPSEILSLGFLIVIIMIKSINVIELLPTYFPRQVWGQKRCGVNVYLLVSELAKGHPVKMDFLYMRFSPGSKLPQKESPGKLAGLSIFT